MKSCDKCMRGPRNNAVSKYCAQCGDDLVYFVPSTFEEERIDVIGQNGNDGEHYGESYLKAHGVPKAQHELNAKAREILDSTDIQPGPTQHYDHIHTLDELAGLGMSENSNNGEHYAHVMSAPPDARIVPVAVNVYNECDDILFSLKAYDEFTVEVEWKTLVGNGNLDECCQLLRDAVAMMNLKG